MKRLTKNLLALLFVFTTLFSLCSFSASAISLENEIRIAKEESEAAENTTTAQSGVYSANKLLPDISYASNGKVYLSAKKVTNKQTSAYPTVTLSHNGAKISAIGRLINGTTYIPVQTFLKEATAMSATYKSQTKTLYVKGAGLDCEIIDGSNVIYANGRTIYSVTPSVLMNDGSMYAPVASMAKVLSLKYSESSNSRTASLSGTPTALVSASHFYDSDAVYWLSRIISAESKGEPLIGQIAVGNIVLNRVKSSLYPNTIWGVIFDRKYGVQFSPIENGTIYQTPTAPSVTAAKICLETYSVLDEGTLFFLAPAASTSSWIQKNKSYMFSIGNHDFYE